MNEINLKIISPKGVFKAIKSDLVTIEAIDGFPGFQYNITPVVTIIENVQIWINSSWSKSKKFIEQNLLLFMVIKKIFLSLLKKHLKLKMILNK
ncbi:hypothetical protein [Mesomycoplasma neurolyticum]|uniref:ATP synthase F1 subunit epsilon n=1 Tax=Mesomycoplasma neurolyticum TaxID=2120 RepID=A0A449A519_9BACT|nr:hypothetical protein [Mesomycoplasma neurolyticum]VEU59253.1 ATP synthase F1 subunit epsilon [Mesomycoplasma neurolyticum]